MDKTDILSLDEKQLEKAVGALLAPKYRAAQIFDWLHNKCVKSFDEMTNIPKDLLLQLSDNFVIIHCSIEKKQKSMYDSTVKYLFSLSDGELVECVVMKYKYGYSICVSTQIGCKVGCTFCASGIFGYKRNLTGSEMLAQVYAAQKDLGVKISHIVLMGMGEPLHNYDNVIKFLRLISSPSGQNISMRRITVSTSGVVPKIYELAKLNLGITLSVSLHAPNDDIRSSIMPINKKWGIIELLTACRYYAKTTSRRVTFEYTMISGVNDSDDCAYELVQLLRGLLCHINLIPVNEVLGKNNIKSNQSRIEAFYLILKNEGLNVTIRRSLGDDIDASCGQLRMKEIDHKEQTRKW
jgi:23S rRNA (adenine2503-C2)-methyltransferase